MVTGERLGVTESNWADQVSEEERPEGEMKRWDPGDVWTQAQKYRFSGI